MSAEFVVIGILLTVFLIYRQVSKLHQMPKQPQTYG